MRLDWSIWCSHICLEPETSILKICVSVRWLHKENCQEMIHVPTHHGYPRKIQVGMNNGGFKKIPQPKLLVQPTTTTILPYWNCHRLVNFPLPGLISYSEPGFVLWTATPRKSWMVSSDQNPWDISLLIPESSKYVRILPFGKFFGWILAQILHTFGRSRYVYRLVYRDPYFMVFL